ncbi:MAG: amidase [Kofleriaceae bacterium]
MKCSALAAAFEARRLTPRDLAERSLWQCRDRREDHMLISIDEEDVRRQADRSTARWRDRCPLSPIDGLAVAIKDQFAVAGTGTTCGCAHADHVDDEDAVAVARLRRAGAILFGKSNMDELALGGSGCNPHHGCVRNPHDATRQSGGSSSGSAALVGAGIAPLALGSDFGGSLRIPAAYCGAFALKPSYGRVPVDGMRSVVRSLEHVGPIASSVDGLIAAFQILIEHTVALPHPHDLVFGICDAWLSRAEAPVRTVVEDVVTELVRSRVRVRQVHLPDLDHAYAIGSLICAAEAAAAFPRPRRRGLGAAVRLTLGIGDRISPAEYVRALAARARFSSQLLAACADVDAIISPTTPRTAPRHRCGVLDEAQISERVAFTFPFNLSGAPVVQAPCGRDALGLPIGVQFAAPLGADAVALALALAVERSGMCAALP